jgi:hypothetical protein
VEAKTSVSVSPLTIGQAKSEAIGAGPIASTVMRRPRPGETQKVLISGRRQALRVKSWPHLHTPLRAGSLVWHFGQDFSQVRSDDFLAFALFSDASRAWRGASARFAAHCGWIPASEYDGLPQTGHVLRSGSTKSGVDFFTVKHVLRN